MVTVLSKLGFQTHDDSGGKYTALLGPFNAALIATVSSVVSLGLDGSLSTKIFNANVVFQTVLNSPLLTSRVGVF